MSETFFLVLAALTVLAAAGVVALRNPVHSAMALVAALFLIAVHYIALEAHLVAALQIIVYAGAVMVLFLFVIMLLNLHASDGPRAPSTANVLGVLAAVGLAAVLVRVLGMGAGTARVAAERAPDYGTTEALARVLFREHAVAFELTSLLLLVAVVGAVVLARRERA